MCVCESGRLTGRVRSVSVECRAERAESALIL